MIEHSTRNSMLNKQKRSIRRHKTQVHIRKQLEIWQHVNDGFEVEPHYFHKKSAMDCGNPQCYLCGNPRRVIGEKTIQEQRADLDDIDELIEEYIDELIEEYLEAI